MPRASHSHVRKEISQELEDIFTYLVSSLHSSSDISQFFGTFLTREEKIMLTKRLMIHVLLHNGYISPEIAAIVNVSKETIRVHKTVWQTGSNRYKTIIAKIAKREKTKILLKKIENFLKPLEYAFNAKTNMKARAKFMSGDYSD